MNRPCGMSGLPDYLRQSISTFYHQSFLPLLFFLVPVLALLSCDQAINPSGTFEPKMVVYSVLNATSDTQYVRVYSAYNPPGGDPRLNPEEQAITDAVVTMTDGSTTIPFRFMTIGRSEKDRYYNPIGLYYAYPFRPRAQTQYTLNVASPTFGQATAVSRMPGMGTVDCFTIAELAQQDNFAYFMRPILVQFVLNDLARAQLIRFYIVYTTENPGDDGREHYYEVPEYWRVINYNFEIHEKQYARPTLRTAPLARRGERIVLTKTFAFPTYNESIHHIRHFNFNVRFKRAVFYLIQFDEDWYKYYASANLFQDKLGVRVDPPDYSNIQGGFGMFGSFRVDSSTVPLPELLKAYPDQIGRKVALESLSTAARGSK